MISSLVRRMRSRGKQGQSWALSVRNTLQTAVLWGAVGACSSEDQIQNPSVTIAELDPLLGTWTAAAAAPVSVQDAAVAVFRGQIYVVGGEGTILEDDLGEVCCVSYATVQRYDPPSNQWEQLRDLPEWRERMALAVVGDTMYAAGGMFSTLGHVGGAQSTLWAYLPEADEWVERPSLPKPRWGASAASVLGRLYVIGGQDKGGRVAADSIAIYDPATGSWRLTTPVPGGIVEATTHNINGILYVVGGSKLGAFGDGYHRILAFNPVDETWTTVTDTPGLEESFASAVLNGRIHLVGGRRQGGSAADYHRIYDLVADQWFQARGPRDPRSDHASVVVGGRLYVLTGVQGQQQDPTADVDVFKLQ